MATLQPLLVNPYADSVLTKLISDHRRINGMSLIACIVLILSLSTSSYTTTHGQSTTQTALSPSFYYSSCPTLQSIVRSSMKAAVQQEARMAASILRLFFHDCFVQGCDGSILLDDTSTFQGEKTAFPNINSVRGFDVIDTIKSNVEAECPGVVSCADILALAARDGVVLSGGPMWSVMLGRRDSTTASYSGANSNLPSPTEDVISLLEKFQAQGLSSRDLVALSGAHTIGQARCVNFRQRLYNQSGDNTPDPTLDTTFLAQLEANCPSSGGDDNLSPLDLNTPTTFDNSYYINLLHNKGLLNSDQELYSSNASSNITSFIQSFSANNRSFFNSFVTSMIAMGNLNPLTGTNGEIRANCRVVN